MARKLVDATLSSKLLRQFKTFLFDCDGVLWNESSVPIGNACSTLNKLRDMGKKIFFITNNSTKTRSQYAERCKALGFQAEENEIICTAWLAAAYLKNIINFKGKVYVIGNNAMVAELRAFDIPCIGVGIEEYRSGFAEYAKIELDPEVNGVVVGYDPYINYAKVLKASSYIQRPGCLFIATNCDSYLPSDGSVRIPGTGSIVEFVACASEKRPTYVGKPETIVLDVLKSLHADLDPGTTLMVGDRLDTDIRFAHACGFQGLLVLTGVNSLEDARHLQASNSIEHQKCVPHYYAASVGALLPLFDETVENS